MGRRTRSPQLGHPLGTLKAPSQLHNSPKTSTYSPPWMCPLTWQRGLCRGLEMLRLPWTLGGSDMVTGSSCRGRSGHRRGSGHENTEAEVGVMQPQGRAHRRLQQLEEAGADSAPQPPDRIRPAAPGP